MQNRNSLITLTLLMLAFAGCSKHSLDATAPHPKVQNLGVVEVSDGIPSHHDLGGGRVCIVAPTIKNDGTILLALRIEEAGKLLAAPKVITKSDQAFELSVGDIGVGFTPHIKQPSAHDKNAVLMGRHMSERQVADIVGKELPMRSSFSCEFKDGVWEILETQKDVWAASSAITNSDGKIFITSTNATRAVLRVRDTDGKVELVKAP